MNRSPPGVERCSHRHLLGGQPENPLSTGITSPDTAVGIQEHDPVLHGSDYRSITFLALTQSFLSTLRFRNIARDGLN